MIHYQYHNGNDINNQQLITIFVRFGEDVKGELAVKIGARCKTMLSVMKNMLTK